MFYVYVLKSIKNDRLYTGHTKNIQQRINEHNSGQTKATRSKGPYILVHQESYMSRSAAMKQERFLKTGKGRGYLKFLGL